MQKLGTTFTSAVATGAVAELEPSTAGFCPEPRTSTSAAQSDGGGSQKPRSGHSSIATFVGCVVAGLLLLAGLVFLVSRRYRSNAFSDSTQKPTVRPKTSIVLQNKND